MTRVVPHPSFGDQMRALDAIPFRSRVIDQVRALLPYGVWFYDARAANWANERDGSYVTPVACGSGDDDVCRDVRWYHYGGPSQDFAHQLYIRDPRREDLRR